MKIINRIVKIKEEKNLTNQDIANLSNIPLATVTRVLNGSTPNPTFETIAKIAIAVGASLDEVSGLTSEKSEDVGFSIGETLNTYSVLLSEKDERIKEKDALIKHLQELNSEHRAQIRKILWFVAAMVTAIVAVLIIDVTNGNFGYFRY